MPKNLDQRLKERNVVIASHIYVTGPPLELENYLIPKTKSLLFIGHPFPYREKTNSFYRLYKNGKLMDEYVSIKWTFPELLFYIRDAVLTLWWVLTLQQRVDLFVGGDNFLTFIGLLLKRLGKVEKVILYTIDYVPNRFESRFLNALYHFFDRQCLKNCDAVWNVSPEIEKARKRIKGLGGSGFTKQITVPLGIWYKRIPKIAFSQKSEGRIMFMGHLIEKQGLQMVIKSLPSVFKKIPHAHLVVIGDGEYKPTLERLVEKEKLGKKVRFLGYIEEHKDVERELARGALAVATYVPDPKSFTYFADPGKIKNYLAAGLPVISTDVPKIARVLEKNNCGVVVEYNQEEIARAIIDLLKNEKNLKIYSQKAKEFAKAFDWNRIFGKALSKSI